MIVFWHSPLSWSFTFKNFKDVNKGQAECNLPLRLAAGFLGEVVKFEPSSAKGQMVQKLCRHTASAILILLDNTVHRRRETFPVRLQCEEYFSKSRIQSKMIQ